jgi:hypothetical protein
VKRFRTASTLLICATLLTLTACGGNDDTSAAAGPGPTAPAAAPASSAAAPTSPAADAAGGGGSDKEICESVKKAGEDMKSSLITALQSGGDPSPALFKKILTQMNKEMETLAAAAESDSKVGASLEAFGKQAAKAASSSDPASAADNPEFEKAGAAITAACKPAGVDVNF